MNFLKKIKWVAGILLIFVIVLTTNLIDKDNFRTLNNTVTTIYEDRVVASDLIFEITILIQEKEIAFATLDSTFIYTKNNQVNDELQDLIKRYEQTKLTKEESQIFNNLKDELSNLKQSEKEFIESNLENNLKVFKSIDVIVHKLYDLSKVQLNEGRRQMMLSKKTMETIDLFTQVEVVSLIFMAILIQIIIIYKPKKS